MAKKRSRNRIKSPAALEKAQRALRDHPFADVLVEDLAAARDHARETCRVGIAADGNPILYGRDRQVLEHIGGAIAKSTQVHARPIPDLTFEEWQVVAAQAEARLLPGGDAIDVPSASLPDKEGGE